MDSLSTRLRNKVELYVKTETTNTLGETAYTYSKQKDVWAEIVPISGRQADSPGEMTYTEITHKITVRVGAVTEIKNDMYFMHGGHRFDIMYFYPHYKYRNCIEIYCKEDVENGTAG